jgi:hypothetical protein
MEAGLVGVGTKIIRLMLSYVVKGTFSRKKFMKLSRQTIVDMVKIAPRKVTHF